MRRVVPKLVDRTQSTVKNNNIALSNELMVYLKKCRDPLDYSFEDTLRRLLGLPTRVFVPPGKNYYKTREKNMRAKLKQYQQQAKFALISKQLEGDE